MAKEPRKEKYEISELEDKALEAVAGGSLPGVDISCEDNETCPNNGCTSGCNPNVGCKPALE